MSQQRGRERNERDREQEGQLNPHVVSVAARQLAQLRALADPEDAQRHEAHDIDKDVRTQLQQLVPQLAFGGRSGAQRGNRARRSR